MPMQVPRRLTIAMAAVLFLATPTLFAQEAVATKSGGPTGRIHSLTITVLSTMLVGDQVGVGEWGFSALVEADGHRILVDTGAHPETVLENARGLGIDLSNVHQVILTHN